MLSSHHLNKFEEYRKLLEVDLLLILLGLECIPLDHGILKETKVTEGVEVELWKFMLLEPVPVASVDTRINNLIEQVPFMDNILGLVDDLIAPVVVVVVAEVVVLVQRLIVALTHVGLVLQRLLLRLVWRLVEVLLRLCRWHFILVIVRFAILVFFRVVLLLWLNLALLR